MNRRLALVALIVTFSALLHLPASAQSPPDPPLIRAPVRVSTSSTFAPDCGGETPAPRAVNVRNGVVEPRIAVNPRDPRHLVAVWQQDRWSDGGAAGLRGAVSRDGGESWTSTAAPFSRCTGGTEVNGGDYQRASDPWVAFAASGTVYQIALAVSGRSGRRTTAMLVSRSTDGGINWSDPVTLIRDTEPDAFNDKQALTTDPTDAMLAYAVWDRIDNTTPRNEAPIWFARTTDGGASWEAARPIYAPPAGGQTIANQIVVLRDGALLNVFTLIERVATGGRVRMTQRVVAIRSTDKGVTWSEPIAVAPVSPTDVTDPDTGVAVRTGAVVIESAVDPVSGAVYVTWQDAGLDAAGRSAIALVTSPDGGRTWSAPVRVNRTPEGGEAFTPNVAVAADGTVGIAFYDTRFNTTDPESLPTAYWLTTCRIACLDPANWQETIVAGPFDLDGAPRTDRGYFLGDYQGLAAAGDTFLLLFAQSEETGEGPSDIWFARAIIRPGSAEQMVTP